VIANYTTEACVNQIVLIYLHIGVKLKFIFCVLRNSSLTTEKIIKLCVKDCTGPCDIKDFGGRYISVVWVSVRVGGWLGVRCQG